MGVVGFVGATGRHHRPHGEWGERGTSTVEFALVSVILFTLLFAIIEVGRVMYIEQALSAAAQEAVRVLIAEPHISQGDLERRVESRITVLDPSALTLHVYWEPQTVRVVTQYPYTPIVPILTSSPITLRAQARLHR